MSQQKKYDVFISSKSEDYPIAEKVYDFLVANGLTVFLASRELRRIGEAEYSEAVDAAIDGSHHMVISGDAFNDGVELTPAMMKSTGMSHVTRGGSWNRAPRFCRVSVRGHSTPNERVNYVGLRVVMEIE